MRVLIPMAVAALGALVALAVSPVQSTATGGVELRTYEGGFLGVGRGGHMDAKVSVRGDRARSVAFRATQIVLDCEDGSQRRMDFLRYRTKVNRDGAFKFQQYKLFEGTGQSYYEVSGRVVGRRRLTGYLYFIGDSFPPNSESNPDCTTLYPQQWNAKRR